MRIAANIAAVCVGLTAAHYRSVAPVEIMVSIAAAAFLSGWCSAVASMRSGEMD